MSRPMRSSSGRSASSRVLISSFSWLIDACATDTLANNCMAMAEHPTLEQASDEELARRVREIMAEMAPLEEALGRLRAQIQQVVSEQKKRERSQHLDGWDFGTAAHPGVRIHVPNSRTEKILQASEVFLRVEEPGG